VIVVGGAGRPSIVHPSPTTTRVVAYWSQFVKGVKMIVVIVRTKKKPTVSGGLASDEEGVKPVKDQGAQPPPEG
jgi:hypothetical protein